MNSLHKEKSPSFGGFEFNEGYLSVNVVEHFRQPNPTF